MCYGSGYNMAGQPCSCGSLRTRILSTGSEIVQLRAENAKLRRVIKDVAIPALALYARTDKAPKVAIQWLQEAVK